MTSKACRQRGALGRTRTPNLLIRSQTLYPIELRARDTGLSQVLSAMTTPETSEPPIRRHSTPRGNPMIRIRCRRTRRPQPGNPILWNESDQPNRCSRPTMLPKARFVSDDKPTVP